MNTPIDTLCDKADNILSSFGVSDNDHKKYSVVKDKVVSYFMK